MNPTLTTVRRLAWVLVAVVALGAGGGYLLLRNAPSAEGSFTLGQGDYTLVDQNGAAVTPASFKGHPSALFFGFTHCPDVCPTTLGEMAAWYEALGAEAADLQGYFVTVDPERDTPEVLEEYVGWVGPQMHAVTGTPDEVVKMTRAWGVLAEKVPTDDGSYTMNHTASVFLVDSQGQFQSTIAYGEDQQTALGKLRALLAKG